MTNRVRIPQGCTCCVILALTGWLSACGTQTNSPDISQTSPAASSAPIPPTPPPGSPSENASHPTASGGAKTERPAETGQHRPAQEPFIATTRPLNPLNSGNNSADAEIAAARSGSPAEPVFRPSDSRARHDDKRLNALGIRAYESKRLKLYTDIDPAIAQGLPALLDQAYLALVDYFGPLPPNREGTIFQLTGYIMADQERFRRAGLLPEDLPYFGHGRHRGAEFWMNDQPTDYYRRHLMIHEATHCFMLIMSGASAPIWYLEGMAELFATHQTDPNGKTHFRVMPPHKEDFAGLGRIEIIQNDVRTGRLRSPNEIARLRPNDFANNSAYAWSWALCHFLDAHPRHRQRFRELASHLTRRQFRRNFRKSFNAELSSLWTEWPLFAAGLEHGYDLERAVIDFRPGEPIVAAAQPTTLEIATDRGWQSSGILVEQGEPYQITATGRYTLADKPKPWISEPQGVSIFYSGGYPIGMLLAAVRSGDPAGGGDQESMLKLIPVGPKQQLTARATGTLYFRVNDFWSDLANNTGTVHVAVQKLAASP